MLAYLHRAWSRKIEVSTMSSQKPTTPNRSYGGKKLRRLNESIARAKANSEFYRERIDVDRLNSLDEIQKLPLTKKGDIRQSDGQPTILRSKDEIREYHTSSGTTSKPFIMALSQSDIERSRKALSETWRMHGLTSEDTVQVMASYGLFTAGILNQYAIQEVGAGVIPAGVQSTDEQLRYITELEPEYLVAVSSYYLRLIDVVEKKGIDLPEFEGLIGGGVPVSEEMTDYISEKLDAPFYNQYGLAEINTAIAGECECHDGLHVQADYAYPEVVDAETLEPVEPGERGILVLTTLQRDAQVLLRYVTNDITAITYEECDCGRTSPRIEPIEGRADDTVFVRGAKVDLSYCQTLMEGADLDVNPFKWQLHVDRENGRDTLSMRVSWNGERQNAELTEYLSNELGLSVDRVVDIEELDANPLKHKLKRIVDDRPQ